MKSMLPTVIGTHAEVLSRILQYDASYGRSAGRQSGCGFK